MGGVNITSLQKLVYNFDDEINGVLKKNKKYWVRMRSYKTAGGRKIYSSYSKVKTIKIRK